MKKRLQQGYVSRRIVNNVTNSAKMPHYKAHFSSGFFNRLKEINTMAKSDWGTLQQQFLAAHAESGISPKEWCEDQGLNYATARRYIKKPAAQSAQKTAHKKLSTAHDKECAKEPICNIAIPTAQSREQDSAHDDEKYL